MARILVVDDEALARFTMREILESAGHQVAEAKDGEEAISSQAAHSYDLIITDIIMPRKEGVETIIELRRDYPDLKIIAVSGGGRTKTLDFLNLASEFGADQILAKPFSPEELLEHVNHSLSA